jgi:hypothetical protein
MLQTAESGRRLFWWVLTVLCAITGVAAWILFTAMG